MIGAGTKPTRDLITSIQAKAKATNRPDRPAGPDDAVAGAPRGPALG